MGEDNILDLYSNGLKAVPLKIKNDPDIMDDDFNLNGIIRKRLEDTNCFYDKEIEDEVFSIDNI